MRINELIVEQQDGQLDEISLAGIGKGIAKGANVAGQTVGAIGRGAVDTVKQFGKGVKQGWQGTKAAMSGDDSGGTGSGNTANLAPASSGGLPGGTAAAPAQNATSNVQSASDSELNQLKATLGKLNPEQKKELAGELEKSMNAPAQQPAPQGAQSLDLDQLKQQSQARQAQGQSDQQAAVQQMKQTQQANAAAAQADNELVAAVKAAKAKPGFQQTAQDKLAIQKGAAKGIHESKKKKKIVAEFKSNFLGMVI